LLGDKVVRAGYWLTLFMGWRRWRTVLLQVGDWRQVLSTYSATQHFRCPGNGIEIMIKVVFLIVTLWRLGLAALGYDELVEYARAANQDLIRNEKYAQKCPLNLRWLLIPAIRQVREHFDIFGRVRNCSDGVLRWFPQLQMRQALFDKHSGQNALALGAERPFETDDILANEILAKLLDCLLVTRLVSRRWFEKALKIWHRTSPQERLESIIDPYLYPTLFKHQAAQVSLYSRALLNAAKRHYPMFIEMEKTVHTKNYAFRHVNLDSVPQVKFMRNYLRRGNELLEPPRMLYSFSVLSAIGFLLDAILIYLSCAENDGIQVRRYLDIFMLVFFGAANWARYDVHTLFIFVYNVLAAYYIYAFNPVYMPLFLALAIGILEATYQRAYHAVNLQFDTSMDKFL
jgi:hypothetical protein